MIREIAKKLFNDEAGVSPIVATLVVIVVAIAGAAAVGAIMGSFSSDVSDSSSSEGAARGAATELLIAGSTTVQPVSEVLAEEFMRKNQGIKVTVQGGGSGAGISSTEMDIVDIGAASEDVDTVNDHPTLQQHQIGASAVVVIANGVNSATVVTAQEVKNLYNNASSTGTVTAAIANSAAGLTASGPVKLYQRDEASGTEETFSKWASGSKTWMDDTNATGANGNAGVLKAVETTSNSIGFVDFGFAEKSSGVQILDLGEGTDKATVKKEILKALTGEETDFPEDLTRPLNYLTNGAPSSLESAFIDFARQPAQDALFEEVGYFSMVDIS